jgi:hypothetical protein
MRRFWAKKQPSHEDGDYDIDNAALPLERPASVSYAHEHCRESDIDFNFLFAYILISFLLATNANQLAKALREMSSIDIVDPYKFCKFDSNKYLGRFPRFSYCIDQVSRQIYLLFLLRLPSMYFERVARVFFMLVKDSQHPNYTHDNMNDIKVMERFDGLWLDFLGTLLTELNTLSIVATLLLSLVTALASFMFLTNVFSAPSFRCSRSQM